MTKITVLWLSLTGFFVSGLLLLFNGSAYKVCTWPNMHLFGLGIARLSPLINCQLAVFLITLIVLIVIPLLTLLLLSGIYVLIFNKSMPFSRTILWFIWLACVYYATFQLYLIPLI